MNEIFKLQYKYASLGLNELTWKAHYNSKQPIRYKISQLGLSHTHELSNFEHMNLVFCVKISHLNVVQSEKWKHPDTHI